MIVLKPKKPQEFIMSKLLKNNCMVYFSAYANQKFGILNNHGVYIRKEQVESAVQSPDKRGKIGRYLTSEKDGVKVVYQKESGVKKIITFYPIK